jgi:hypothetical protein
MIEASKGASKKTSSPVLALTPTNRILQVEGYVTSPVGNTKVQPQAMDCMSNEVTLLPVYELEIFGLTAGLVRVSGAMIKLGCEEALIDKAAKNGALIGRSVYASLGVQSVIGTWLASDEPYQL